MAAFDLLGRRGALRLLWELRAGSLTFRALQAAAATNPALLNRRLKELREAGLVRLGDAGYELTADGDSLYDALDPLSAWAARWAHPSESGEAPASSAPGRPESTLTVVRRHFAAFAKRGAMTAVLADYDDEARLYTESRIYRGTAEIRGFYSEFLGTLPAGAAKDFAVQSLRADGEVGLATWSLGRHVPMGSDTFVVRAGRIVAQTVVMPSAAG